MEIRCVFFWMSWVMQWQSGIATKQLSDLDCSVNTSHENATQGNASNTPHFIRCEQFELAVYGVLIVVFGVVCVVGNVLAIATFCRGPRNSPALLFSALAAADVLVAVPACVLRAVRVLCHRMWSDSCSRWITGGPHVAVGVYISPVMGLASLASVWLTVLVTFNRYIAVCRPLQTHRLASLRVVGRQLVVVLGFCFLCSLPKWFEGRFHYVCFHGRKISRFAFNDFADKDSYYEWSYRGAFMVIVQFLVPLALIVFLTLHLVRALRQAQEKRRTLLAHTNVTKLPVHDFSMSISLLGVVLVFLICQIPYGITRILHPIFKDEYNHGTNCLHWLYYFRRVGELLLVLNSSSNFFIFLLCSGQFRHQLRTMLTSCPGTCSRTGFPRPGQTAVRGQSMATSVLSKSRSSSSVGSRGSRSSHNSALSKKSSLQGHQDAHAASLLAKITQP